MVTRTAEISKRFHEYFDSQGHVFLPGSSLLHPSIPMSFVMSAGLVQIETALNNNVDLKGQHFSLTQKCFRYFDVGQVGRDVSHLSLFEMPGAFSFVSSSKESTINKMWQVVTEVLGIDKNRLWVTFFGGGEVSGHYFGTDGETLNTWRQLPIPDARLIALGPAHNYWKQGGGINGLERYRKCGPNTEIFYDRGEEFRCNDRCYPGCKCDRFIEFANALFVGDEIDEQTNILRRLPNPFTEIVIGSERVAMILQNKHSVFDIDTIAPIIDLVRAYEQISDLDATDARKSDNIIADHVRALIHLVADGAPPAGKNGRQRLIKILIRETLTHALLLRLPILEILDDLIKMVLGLSEIPVGNNEIIKKTTEYFQSEARRFSNVQIQGHLSLHRYIEQNDGQTLTGQQIVTLEKQQGLPGELSRLYLEKRGLPFLEDEYRFALQDWKNSLPLKI